VSAPPRSAATILALLVACSRSPAGDDPRPVTPPTTPARTAHGGPRWPAPAAPPTPPGFERRAIHHETIHVDLAVPIGARVSLERDVHGYPSVAIDVDGFAITLQFDSGVGQLGVTLSRTPPRVYSLAAQKASATPDNVTARYLTSGGDLRILGVAPGVKCRFEPYGQVPEPTLDRIFTVCASLRAPVLGPWRAATPDERAHGGMTDVPAGAWVEGALPSTPGSLLRPGKFIASMHVGRFVASSTLCPSSFDELRDKSAPEVEVVVERKASAGGEAWIRKATEEYNGDRFPGATTLIAPRDGRCCTVSFIPWTTFPSAIEIDCAIALCDTFRAR